MNSLEKLLHYPLGDAMPAPGETLEVVRGEATGLAPAVRWIRMGLPFALDHINLWLLRDEIDGRAGWTVVDCCITRDESKAQWQRVFDTQLEGLPILRVIVTHMHPDHIGLAHWLCERWQAPLWISATDFSAARIASMSTTGFGGPAAANFFASHGLADPESLEKIRGRASYYPSMVPDVPRSFRRLQEGRIVRIGGRDWRCISGYGHAPEHIALYCDSLRLLISGDMMLPRISTNVSVHDIEPESNPLQVVPRFDRQVPGACPRTRWCCPRTASRSAACTNASGSCTTITATAWPRWSQACAAAPQTAADLLPLLFKRKLDLHQTTFAMGESIAHLHALWFAGKLRRVAGADGVYRFAPA